MREALAYRRNRWGSPARPLAQNAPHPTSRLLKPRASLTLNGGTSILIVLERRRDQASPSPFGAPPFLGARRGGAQSPRARASSFCFSARRRWDYAAAASTLNDITASINRNPPPAKAPTDEAGLRRFAEEWGARYEKNPKDKTAAIAYAKALLALKQTSQAMAILQGLALQYPQDMSVLAAYGKGLASAGQLNQAAEVLSHAHTPEKPDWSVVSTQGTIADELGDHEAARRFYDEALKIRPDDPGVLSNLGLSYALSRQLPRAEETLKQAAIQPGADMRVRQNLALVLALEGKFDQAEEWSRRDLSAHGRGRQCRADQDDDLRVQHLARHPEGRAEGETRQDRMRPATENS